MMIDSAFMKTLTRGLNRVDTGSNWNAGVQRVRRLRDILIHIEVGKSQSNYATLL